MRAFLKELARALLIQRQVVDAILLRETRSAYGDSKLGYLWSFMGPVSRVAMFAGIYFVTNRHPSTGPDIVGFVATGVLPYTAFRSTASRAAKAITSAKSLLYFPHVQPLDLVLAKGTLEFVSNFAFFAVIMFANSVYLGSFKIDDVLPMLLGWLMIGALGFSFGLVWCGASVFAPVIDRFMNVLMRPLFWTSGLFFTLNELPPVARDIVTYNPILHCVEYVRDGWFQSYTPHYASLEYPALWALGMAFFGLSMERVTRQKLGTT